VFKFEFDSMIKRNIEDRITQLFEGFKPEVQGQWRNIESKLDAQMAMKNGDMIHRVRSAERFAIGATFVAVALTAWMVYPLIAESFSNPEVQTKNASETNGDDSPSYIVVDQLDTGVSTSVRNATKDAPASGIAIRKVFQESVARTSTSVKMFGTDLDAKKSKRSMLLTVVDVVDAGQLEESVEGDALHTNILEEVGNEGEVFAVSLMSSVQEACEGTEVEFALGESMDSGSILWNFGDGSFSQESNPSHVFNRPGSYDITVSVRSHDNGFIRTKSIEDMIVIRPKPEAAMDWDFSMNIGDGIEVQLVDQTEKASSSTWVMTEQGLSGSHITVERPGNYPVNLVVSNAYGCQDIAVGNIEIGDRHDAGAPAMFSPNGDGRYDVFLPESANETHSPWFFSVFNVEGQLVFESRNVRKPWKGQIRGGGRARIGERFFWNLELTNSDGSKSIHSDEVRIDG